MVRIIPWSLPPVKGGSIGGYTPKVDPDPPSPEPDLPLVYYDFSGVSFLPDNTTDVGTVYAFAPTNSASFTKGTASVSGIVTVDNIGVSSISVVIEGSSTKHYAATTDDLVFSINPAGFGMTFVSGTLTPKNTSSNANCYIVVDKATFFVYNGNGEIIQSEEVTFGGGE